MYEPVLDAKWRMLAGQSATDAMTGSLATLLRSVATETADDGRSATGAAIASTAPLPATSASSTRQAVPAAPSWPAPGTGTTPASCATRIASPQASWRPVRQPWLLRGGGTRGNWSS